MRKQATVLILFVLAMAISLVAQSSTSSPNSQPQAPSSSQAPAAKDQSTPPAGATAQKDPVAEALQLTDEQQAKLQPIIQEEMIQINAVRNDTSLTDDQKRQKVEQIRQTEFPKIEAILTPDQRKKLAELQDQAKQRANQQGTQTNAPNNPPPQQPPQ
ncbi:MAG TPA: hypothetical protein VH437_08715 [Terriglobales bacterium]|jgi:Spy/CpxP family protein refolding chaperone